MRNVCKGWPEESILQKFTVIIPILTHIPPNNSRLRMGLWGGDTSSPRDISDWSSLILFCSGSEEPPSRP